MRVIGIDPGTRNVGYGVVEQQGSRLVRLDSGAIKAIDSSSIAERLVGIHRALQVVILEWKPEAAAIETVFCGNNAKTAIAIGEGRGVALLSAAEAGVEVVEYEPTLVKRAVCGNGMAKKEQVMRTIAMLLSLPEMPATDHESDALALALCHLNRARLGLGGNGKKELPAAVQAALAKLPPRPKRIKGLPGGRG